MTAVAIDIPTVRWPVSLEGRPDVVAASFYLTYVDLHIESDSCLVSERQP